MRKLTDEEVKRLIEQGREAMLIDVCECGHDRLEHEGKYNEGNCVKCSCKRFTWAYWGVDEEEYEKVMKNGRI